MHGRPSSGSASSACASPRFTSTLCWPERGCSPKASVSRLRSSSQPEAIALAGIRRPASAIAAPNSRRSSAQEIAS